MAPAAEELLGRLRQVENAWRRPCVGGLARPALGWSRSPAAASFAVLGSGSKTLPGGWTSWKQRPGARRGRRLLLARRQLDNAAARLESLSPLAVLARGYSITQRVADGRLLCDAAELTIGEQITSRLARGRVISRVEEVEG